MFITERYWQKYILSRVFFISPFSILDIIASDGDCCKTNGAPGFDWFSLIPMALVLFVMYFFLVRPQQRKEQERRNMIALLAPGDVVILRGGAIGSIVSCTTNEIQLQIATDVTVRYLKEAVEAKYTTTHTTIS